MEEIWKDIENYNGIYQISNLGNIKSLGRKVIQKNGKVIYLKTRILKPVITKNGYLQTILSKSKKTERKYVHRLVAQAFIENYNEKLEVNHKDFNRLNNNLNNLECITHAENYKYSFNRGRIPAPPPQESKKIKCLIDNKDFNSLKEAATYYNINITTICNQLKGRTKTAKGLKFEYILN